MQMHISRLLLSSVCRPLRPGTERSAGRVLSLENERRQWSTWARTGQRRASGLRSGRN